MAKSLCLRHPGHGLELVLGHTTSAGEQVASWALGAAIIKTLHQIGAVSMDKASLFPVRPVMFVDGDDPSKKPVVMSLVAKLGFEPVDAGPLRIPRLLEPYGMLYRPGHQSRARAELCLRHDHPIGSCLKPEW